MKLLRVCFDMLWLFFFRLYRLDLSRSTAVGVLCIWFLLGMLTVEMVMNKAIYVVAIQPYMVLTCFNRESSQENQSIEWWFYIVMFVYSSCKSPKKKPSKDPFHQHNPATHPG